MTGNKRVQAKRFAAPISRPNCRLCGVRIPNGEITVQRVLNRLAEQNIGGLRYVMKEGPYSYHCLTGCGEFN
jgi:hypothetical protein